MTVPGSLVKIGQGVDPYCTLFMAETHVIRAIKPEHAERVSKLLDLKIIQQLMKQGRLIDTKVSQRKIEGYPLVLEHPRIRHPNFPFEWTPSMFKDAALAMLSLNLELIEAGQYIHDPHAWNVMYDSATPKIIDFTSIVPVPTNASGEHFIEFEHSFIRTLKLMERGFPSAARALATEHLSYPDRDLSNATIVKAPNKKDRYLTRESKRLKKALRMCIGEAVSYAKSRNSVPSQTSLKQTIENYTELTQTMNVRPEVGKWSEYYTGKHNDLPQFDGSLSSLEHIKDSTPKHGNIDALLAKIKPSTVLDLGCNNGLYGLMAAQHGAVVVGLDTDEMALDDMYLHAKESGSAVLPLYANVMAPVEAVGFALRPMPRLVDRMKSDLVLCLALVHHLTFGRASMSFDHTVSLLSVYSTKSLIVEFVTSEDHHLKKTYPNPPAWYTVENFSSQLKQHFSTVEILPSHPESRLLFHCTK